MEESAERAAELRRRKQRERRRKWELSLTEEQRERIRAMRRKNYHLHKHRVTEEQKQRNRIRRKNNHFRKQIAANNAAIAAANKAAIAAVGDVKLQGSTSLRAIASPPHHGDDGSNLKSLPLRVARSVNVDPKEIAIQKEKDNNSPMKEIKLFGKSILLASS